MLYINIQTNTRVPVNCICAALKVTACYIPAATVCFILIIKQQKTNSKSLFLCVLLILFTLVFCCGVEHRDISLVSNI